MKITSVKVRKIEKENSNMRGIASVTLDDEFVVHDIKIIDGRNGLFIAMPSKKLANGEHKDIAHPITQDVRTMFQEAILEAYENAEDPVSEPEE